MCRQDKKRGCLGFSESGKDGNLYHVKRPVHCPRRTLLLSYIPPEQATPATDSDRPGYQLRKTNEDWLTDLARIECGAETAVSNRNSIPRYADIPPTAGSDVPERLL